MWDHLTRLIGIQRSLTTAHHPQADGQTEVMNQTLEIALRTFVNPHLNDWVDILPGFALSYNTTTHSSTKQTPAFLLRGFEPLSPSNLLSQTSRNVSRPAIESQSAINFSESMKAIRQQAQDALVLAQS